MALRTDAKGFVLKEVSDGRGQSTYSRVLGACRTAATPVQQ